MLAPDPELMNKPVYAVELLAVLVEGLLRRLRLREFIALGHEPPEPGEKPVRDRLDLRFHLVEEERISRLLRDCVRAHNEEDPLEDVLALVVREAGEAVTPDNDPAPIADH